jgi:hypothetical protein
MVSTTGSLTEEESFLAGADTCCTAGKIFVGRVSSPPNCLFFPLQPLTHASNNVITRALPGAISVVNILHFPGQSADIWKLMKKAVSCRMSGAI